jgi:hypothetical protein
VPAVAVAEGGGEDAGNSLAKPDASAVGGKTEREVGTGAVVDAEAEFTTLANDTASGVECALLSIAGDGCGTCAGVIVELGVGVKSLAAAEAVDAAETAAAAGTAAGTAAGV